MSIMNDTMLMNEGGKETDTQAQCLEKLWSLYINYATIMEFESRILSLGLWWLFLCHKLC